MRFGAPVVAARGPMRRRIEDERPRGDHVPG
jgi:hypothetical protein